MAVQTTQIGTTFVGEVQGIDLKKRATDDEVRAVREAIEQYGVLVFPDQWVNAQQQIDFSLRFGQLQGGAASLGPEERSRLAEGLLDVSNIAPDNKVMAPHDKRLLGVYLSRRWHTDRTYKPLTCKYAFLSAHSVVDEGGETEFADMRAAYDDLPDRLKQKIEGLVVEHDIFHMRAQVGFAVYSPEERALTPPSSQPLVRTGPRGRQSLYLSAHASRVLGMSPPESAELLYQLTDFATQRKYVHVHRWQVGNLVMWDNWTTMHRSRPHWPEDQPRDMRRTSVEIRSV